LLDVENPVVSKALCMDFTSLMMSLEVAANVCPSVQTSVLVFYPVYIKLNVRLDVL